MSKFKFVSTSDSIVVTKPDGSVVTVQKTAPNYLNLAAALKSGVDEDIEAHLDMKTSIESWARGHFKINGNTVLYKDQPVAQELAERMFGMAAKGENPISLMNFWEKLQRNPSMRSVEQLYPFLKHQGIPILPNGNFLAYKGVKSNYTDQHSGVVDNKPGVVNEMPRNKVSDDPSHACHYGFHVGDLSYAQSFAAVTVVCEVDPADVVAIPFDSNQRKMRVCKYRVCGNHNGELLPSTTYALEEDIGKGTEVLDDDKEEFVGIDPKAVTLKELQIAKTSKVEAIKVHKERTGKGLKESHAAITEALALLVVQEREEQKAKIEAKKTKTSVKSTKTPVEKQLKKQREEDKVVRLKVPREFKKIHEMKLRQLLDEDLQTLRNYATQVLHIVGASKILGGKTALVARIIKVRSSFR